MAARFLIRDWDTLVPKDQNNIQSLLKSVIGVDAVLDISHEPGEADDIRNIDLSPRVLAAAADDYADCIRQGGSPRECRRKCGVVALFSTEYFPLC